jgi:hypothetical protein
MRNNDFSTRQIMRRRIHRWTGDTAYSSLARCNDTRLCILNGDGFLRTDTQGVQYGQVDRWIRFFLSTRVPPMTASNALNGR